MSLQSAKAEDSTGSLHDDGESYVSGTSAKALLGMTIGSAFDKTVEQWGYRDALVIPRPSVDGGWERGRENPHGQH
jgi:hypothetical protein